MVAVYTSSAVFQDSDPKRPFEVETDKMRNVALAQFPFGLLIVSMRRRHHQPHLWRISLSFNLAELYVSM